MQQAWFYEQGLDWLPVAFEDLDDACTWHCACAWPESSRTFSSTHRIPAEETEKAHSSGINSSHSRSMPIVPAIDQCILAGGCSHLISSHSDSSNSRTETQAGSNAGRQGHQTPWCVCGRVHAMQGRAEQLTGDDKRQQVMRQRQGRCHQAHPRVNAHPLRHGRRTLHAACGVGCLVPAALPTAVAAGVGAGDASPRISPRG